ncbi:GNAT family N-acetyltransferase [Gynurincola endophyticus]|uniref:GNAT family N-acetyltransferase n=1 Tax=Gynurincola endophyticus TaxID=2479004 RepID=UPI000F8C5BEC|nr:GNAT family N-acetyltransferase [Gynurincola endophyticus]
MKEEYLHIPLNRNVEDERFELTVEGYTAFIEYDEKEQGLRLLHTESPEELAGRGVATALVEKTLVYLEGNNYKIVPLCQMVFAYIKKHPEWKRIVADDFLPRFH